MEIYAIIGIGIVSAVMALVLKQYKPEYAMMVSLVCCVLILLAVIEQVSDLMGTLNAMLATANIPVELTAVLFKALGICIVTQLASDTCKDAGESAIASKLELAGKVAVLVIAMPLFNQLIGIAVMLFAI